jgi:hypothetical protein
MSKEVTWCCSIPAGRRWQALAGKDNKRFLAGGRGLGRDGALSVAL